MSCLRKREPGNSGRRIECRMTGQRTPPISKDYCALVVNLWIRVTISNFGLIPLILLRNAIKCHYSLGAKTLVDLPPDIR